LNGSLKIIVSLVLFLLAASSLMSIATHVDAYSTKDTLPSAQSITVPNGYFIPVEIDTFANSSWIDFAVNSNVSISTALMDSAQYNIFNNSATDDISNALTEQNGTTDNQDIHVSSGAYFLVFFDYDDSGTANVTFTYQAYPVTPFVDGALFPPEPTGLASFGIYNDSGNAVPYEIKTNSLVGAANITSLQAYNASAATLNDTVSGTTLQLNAMLVVNQNDSQYVYWAQNTPDFVTNVSQVSYGDNFWNNSDANGFLSNQSVISSDGNDVYPTDDNGTSQYYYGFSTNNYTYVEPFDIKLLMNDSILPHEGVLLQMGAQVLSNGSQTVSMPIFWFDNITINDPNVQSAYFYVSGNDSTPIGTFYDAELVFAGEGNSEATNFTKMDSTLGLFYLNSSSNQMSPFPSYYSFGGDTGEATYNLRVQYTGNGLAQVTIGTPNYVYLSTNQNSETTTSSSFISSGTSAVSSSTLFSSSAIQRSTTQTAQSSQTSKQSSSGASLITGNYILIVIPVIVIMIILGAFASRRKSARL
jgi:thermopsin